MPEADIIIAESTYGDKLHEHPPAQYDRFLSILQDTCVKRQGKLIIPAFSVGRTQEIVYLLDQLETAGKLPKIPVYVDSPLAVNATEVFGVHPECFDDQLNTYMLTDPNPFGFNDLHYVRTVAESKRINAMKDPCIVISSSGMMNFGRIRHHMYNNIEDPRNTFLIVGYCSPGTTGGHLKSGADSVKIFGDWKMVRSKIEVMDSFSAHGDQKEMRDVLLNQKGQASQVFLVHGEIDRQEVYKDYLESEGFSGVYIPEHGEEVGL
jgi:metallo-beta-lactamase family protein